MLGKLKYYVFIIISLGLIYSYWEDFFYLDKSKAPFIGSLLLLISFIISLIVTIRKSKKA